MTGREQFNRKYEDDLRWEADWLRAGSGMKVDAAQRLLARNGIHPTALAELGCGVGAVIEECRRRGLAGSYIAIDASTEAITYLKNRDPAIDARVADITDAGFRLPAGVDVVVVSHVLEHLEEPQKCLHNLLLSRAVDYAVLEVPLECLPLGRLKAGLLGSRRDTSAGHVQCYTGATFRSMVRACGLLILDDDLYAPVLSQNALRLVFVKRRWPRWRRTLRTLTARHLPERLPWLWTRLYHAHYAVLVSVRPPNGVRGA